ncbi:tumor protein D52-like isoform X3 [Centruroides sculpturatus]|uniref:tumor protein D52-like isoform X3 n=1 Tax=Centruroides sculpturatus TaxID=218467 RepID=UPI000C6CD158|nr:tumor protein D52-like isoform X3 [Centruroides sculpturatus]
MLDHAEDMSPREMTKTFKLDLTDNYHRYLRIAADENDDKYSFNEPPEVKGYDATPDSGVHDLSSMYPEQRAKLEEELKNELAKTEDEIVTLRQVLSDRVRHAQELKRKLGITPWKEFKDDMEQGFRNIQESSALPGIFSSTAYQKTSSTLKTAGEKTTTAIGTISASVTKKLSEVKNSTAFKSFEEKVGSAYSNVKTKMAGSRSNSVNSFEEALSNAEGRSSKVASPATTPVIPEGKPLS